MSSTGLSTPGARRWAGALFAVLMAVMLVVGGIMSTAPSVTGTGVDGRALADESSDKKDAESKYNDFAVKGEDGSVDQRATLTKAMEADPEDRESFAYVFRRLLAPGYYLNATPMSAKNAHDTNCDVDDPAKGTLVYHNCDVPNIITEAVQDIYSLYGENGISGGETMSNALWMPDFGLPSDIPGGGAPANPDERQEKYTGLELYGYNLRYTTYSGEWDHIKVMTAARAMANYGWLDSLNLAVTSVFNGVTSAISKAGSNAINAFSKGDILGGFAGFFTGLFVGGTTGVLNTIMDSSDQNVFDLYAWYRVAYGRTLYGARELTTEEMAARAQQMLISAINASAPNAAKTPDDLAAIRQLPTMPAEDIASCVVTKTDGTKEERLHSDTAPGPSESACKLEQKSVDRNKKSEWTVDGNGKKEPLADWRSRNESLFSTAAKYGIDAPWDSDESKREDTIRNLRAGWEDKWQAANATAVEGEQTDINLDYIASILGGAVKAIASADPGGNYNAPWNRYVCVDSQGRDMIGDDGRMVPVYNLDGTKNSGCPNSIRPPIQGGLLGDGYLATQAQPARDTRHASTPDMMAALVGADGLRSTIANNALNLAGTFTRVSNTALGLSYAPILESLGINDAITMLVKILRDGVFGPLMAAVAMLMLAYAFYRAFTRGDGGLGGMLRLVAITVAASVAGTIILADPARAVAFVDRVPAKAERVLAGAIFSFGNSAGDDLCTATGGKKSGDRETGFDGKALDYNPSDGVRAVMCENWRAFYFNPYVAGQWGDDYKGLYANGLAPEGDEDARELSNSNTDLVGDAGVNMGGGHVEHNWALYQVDQMGTGTATYSATGSTGHSVKPNLYRAVDAQAGPDNGAGTDPSHFDAWSGGGQRWTAAMFSPVVAFVGMLTVVTYSFTKIVLNITTPLLLLLAPFMLLVALHPTVGVRKARDYFANIMGLMVQRVALGLVLIVMLRVITGMGGAQAGGSYAAGAIMAIMTCFAVLMERKTIMAITLRAVDGIGAAARGVGGRFSQDPFNAHHELDGNGLVANKAAQARVAVRAGVGGFIAGTWAGGIAKGASSARSAIRDEGGLLRIRQRRRGFKTVQTALQVSKGMRERYDEHLMKDANAQAVIERMNDARPGQEEYLASLAAYDAIKAVEQEGRRGAYKIDPSTGKRVMRPKAPARIDVTDKRTIRRVVRAADARSEYVRTQNKLLDGYEYDTGAGSDLAEKAGRARAKWESASAEAIGGKRMRRREVRRVIEESSELVRRQDEILRERAAKRERDKKRAEGR